MKPSIYDEMCKPSPLSKPPKPEVKMLTSITIELRDDGYGNHYIVATLPDGKELDAPLRNYCSQGDAVAAVRGALATIGITTERP